MPLSVVVFGATGDLAKKKLFPALYQLCLLGHLPRGLKIVGYGRKAVDLEAFIAKQCANIKEDPRLPKASFTERIAFHAGGYDAADSYIALDATLQAFEAGRGSNRLFFLSVPPTIFGSVTEMISQHAVPMHMHIIASCCSPQHIVLQPSAHGLAALSTYGCSARRLASRG